jgi:23S rRNA (pseudouridine1915-N3)-methyltransferase
VKIVLLQIGKTNDSYIREGIGIYTDRLKNYITFEIKTLPDVKRNNALSIDLLKESEGKMILDGIPAQSFVVLLDEQGAELTSKDFAVFIQKQLLSSIKNLIFVIGGAYGFSEAVYQRANIKVALSKMTFSHQMVRLVFIEQLYRAWTIIKNEPYHH